MISYSVKIRANKDRVQQNGDVSLYLQVIINREVKFLPLDLKWPIKFVDAKSGKILPRMKKDPDHNDYQMIINNEIAKINEVFKIYRIQENPLDMKMFLHEMKHHNVRKDFIEYMSMQLDLRLQYKQIDVRTHKNGKGTVTRLKEFKGNVPFFILTDKFMAQFATWLKTKCGNSEGMVWSRLKDVKTYTNLADNDDLSVPKSFWKFKIKTSSSTIIYLESNEIEQLVKLYNKKTLLDSDQHILAAFLFSCFTGLRISDVSRVSWQWMSINKTLRFIPFKNRKSRRELEIPVGNIAKNFIQNSRDEFFNLPTDQEINRRLKDIAIEAGVETKITFHVARHTFGTHYYRQTKDVVTLQKLMGHSQMQTTMVYVHVNDQDKQTGINTMNDSFEKSINFLRIVS